MSKIKPHVGVLSVHSGTLHRFVVSETNLIFDLLTIIIKNNKDIRYFSPQNAMQIVGFMDHEAESVLEVVAAVLKLGNIEFKPESRVNGLDESKIKDKNGKSVENQLCVIHFF